jgi:hypothetical protein
MVAVPGELVNKVCTYAPTFNSLIVQARGTSIRLTELKLGLPLPLLLAVDAGEK